MSAHVVDRVFVPAAFFDRLQTMPAWTTAPLAKRERWLRAQLADLTSAAVLSTGRGVEALQLATQLHRVLATLPALTTVLPTNGGTR